MKSLKIVLTLFLLSFSINLIGQTVYTTKTGEKYHQSNCRYLKYSKYEVQLKKALELGYDACSVCKPPIKVSPSNASANSLNSSSSKPSNSSPQQRSEAVQCSGKTKAGSRCKRRTKNADGRCYQH